MISKEYVLKYYLYNPDTGIFTRQNYFPRGTNSLTPVGNLDKSTGYYQTEINDKKYYLHRLAFLYMEGYYPEYVDHINRVRTDNSWKNLRIVTSHQNAHNTSIRSDSTTGVKGVSIVRNTAYTARVIAKGKLTHKLFPFREFSSKEEALQAATSWVKETRETLHKDYHNHI